MSTLTQLKSDLRSAADPKKAAFFPRFFRTGKGEYGEGDRFLGVTVPHIRRIAKTYRDLPLADIERLLRDAFHEVRLASLLILVHQFDRSDAADRRRIVRFYLKNSASVNNWDLVDLSAPNILGRFLLTQVDASTLDRLARSTNLWKQRIAIVATHAFIRAGRFDHTLRIAQVLLGHRHDLIHKAVGWMLREVGKRDLAALETFLTLNAATMPRTMLRYAIEKFDAKTRTHYLQQRSLKATK